MANWFVAFKIDHGSWFKEMLPHLPEGLKFFHPDDLHMTIAFFGNFDEKLKSGVIDTIKDFLFEPVTMKSRGIIVLPSPRRFSAICLDFQLPSKKKIDSKLEYPSNSQIEEVYFKQNQFHKSINIWKNIAYKAANVPADTRPFLPHVTIARPPRDISALHREKLLGELKKIPPMEITISLETIALYTWSDHRIGKADPHATHAKERQFKIVYPEGI